MNTIEKHYENLEHQKTVFGERKYLTYKEKRAKAKEFKNKGFNNKHIATILNVTEQTVGRWVKKFKELEKTDLRILNALKDKLYTMIRNDKSTPKQIIEMIKAIEDYKKML